MVSVLAFESVDPAIDIYDVADSMSAKGWHLNALQDPPGIHVAVTMPMVKAVDIYSGSRERKGSAAGQGWRSGGEAERARQRVVCGCGQNSG
jgi:hypothetical protein